jgi:hypothetical protein
VIPEDAEKEFKKGASVWEIPFDRFTTSYAKKKAQLTPKRSPSLLRNVAAAVVSANGS